MSEVVCTVIDLGHAVARVKAHTGGYITMQIMRPANDGDNFYSPAESAEAYMRPDRALALAQALLDFAGSPPAHAGDA